MMSERNTNYQGRGKRKRWLGGIGVLGLLMLFSHQNCSPANMSAANSSGSGLTGGAVEAPMPVTVIDDSKSQAGVSFTFSEVAIAAQANDMDLGGVCSKSQDGATLGWHIDQLNDDGTIASRVATGYSECAVGEFHVQMDSLQSRMPCGHRYKIRAQLGLGSPGEALISHLCAASAAN